MAEVQVAKDQISAKTAQMERDGCRIVRSKMVDRNTVLLVYEPGKPLTEEQVEQKKAEQNIPSGARVLPKPDIENEPEEEMPKSSADILNKALTPVEKPIDTGKEK